MSVDLAHHEIFRAKVGMGGISSLKLNTVLIVKRGSRMIYILKWIYILNYQSNYMSWVFPKTV